jgi:hypothetical protein
MSKAQVSEIEIDDIHLDWDEVSPEPRSKDECRPLPGLLGLSSIRLIASLTVRIEKRSCISS